MTTTQDLVTRYFVLAAAEDLEAYFAQFADDAVVEDEGHVHRGIGAVRAWRTSVPPVTYDVRDVEPTADGHRALVVISGDFPGSPVTLAFAFGHDGERIRTLTIRPVG
ncbi:nuclear transport factor 2 family protein [Actinomycetospora sp. TBRC 11914]|uniref:nuclear transport factor 2 family protein n=1 Tax=Actinomycetospora sp. TBRC 11914 TaxID=2729387 RepID=UPI00145E774D|nr:nuclear transport factor 2 family protein [Actinomycetospora sp. TBRC 11914]NMO88553.1 nuclear transport factor 2 family protein [Actinomycetospora sp. TBRC 11914]